MGALAVTDNASGVCRGLGVVEMSELPDVAVAFSLLNNSELNRQKIRLEPDPALKNGKARNRAVVEAERRRVSASWRGILA